MGKWAEKWAKKGHFRVCSNLRFIGTGLGRNGENILENIFFGKYGFHPPFFVFLSYVKGLS